MTERTQIPKRIRFEVFKRDSFTCQYCGKKAPDVILHIDHIIPVSKGGTNEIINLVTSCEACNLGKSNILLSDNSVIEIQRHQAELKQEAQEQKEMLFEWYNSLKDTKEDSIRKLTEYWKNLGQNQYQLTDTVINGIRSIRNSNSDEEILEAMNIAERQYFTFENKIVTKESYEYAFSKLAGIIRGRKYDKAHPDESKLYYIRGILKNRLKYYYDGQKAIDILKNAYSEGLSIDELTEITKRAHSWSSWKEDINQIIIEKKQNICL